MVAASISSPLRGPFVVDLQARVRRDRQRRHPRQTTRCCTSTSSRAPRASGWRRPSVAGTRCIARRSARRSSRRCRAARRASSWQRTGAWPRRRERSSVSKPHGRPGGMSPRAATRSTTRRTRSAPVVSASRSATSIGGLSGRSASPAPWLACRAILVRCHRPAAPGGGSRHRGADGLPQGGTRRAGAVGGRSRVTRAGWRRAARCAAIGCVPLWSRGRWSAARSR